MSLKSSNRLSKRELITIDDDDSCNEQPASKSRKAVVEPITSPEVVELQREMAVLKQTVAKLGNNLQSPEVIQLQRKVAELQEANATLENKFQGACRIAGEAQARVKFLEELVDRKPNNFDLAKSKEREEELENKVSELTDQLEEQRKKYRARKEQKVELKKKVNDLESQLNEKKEKRRRREEEEEKNDAHLAEMIRMQIERKSATITPTLLHDNADPTNILQLFHTEATETISVESALEAVEALIKKHGRENVFKDFAYRMKPSSPSLLVGWTHRKSACSRRSDLICCLPALVPAAAIDSCWSSERGRCEEEEKEEAASEKSFAVRRTCT